MFSQYLLPVIDYIGNHPQTAIAIVFLISMGEALFMIGLFVPSTVVLVGAGTLVGMGKLSLMPIFAATMLGAIAGDALSYWIGHRFKEHIRLIWPFSRYTALLDRGEAYFSRHGGKSIFVGRFIPGIKAVVPGIAGIAGMDPVRFAVINVVSAIAWTASHLLPGMGLGRGLDIANSANPRLVELLLLTALTAVIAWYTAKLAITLALPYADAWRGRIVVLLSGRTNPAADFLRRLMINEENILIPFVSFALGILGLSGFVMILAEYLADPAFVRSDEAISAYLQSLRTPVFDNLMVGVTMLGDSAVLTPVATGIIIVLLIYQRWKLAGAIATAFISASVFVPLVKTIIHRARPITLYSGADGYSFPSGHATLSATVIGISALVIAQDFSTPIRRAIYLGAAVTVGLIAFSRLYLSAHWPSDVAAGLLFGGSLVFVLAWLLHGRIFTPASKYAAALTAVMLVTVYPYHLSRGYAAAQAGYAIRENPVTLTRPDWLSSGWRQPAQQRVLMNGDFGESFIIQTDLAIGAVTARLEAAGWKRDEGGQIASLVDALLPTRAPLEAGTALPSTHSGRPPLAILTQQDWPIPDGAERRIVLRIWPSGFQIDSQGSERPLLLLSATTETLAPLAFGFALREQAYLSNGKIAGIASAAARALGGNVRKSAQDGGMPLLVAQ